MATEFKTFNIPKGWNALLNHKDKVAIVLGENKSEKSSANTSLELINKKTEAELIAHIQTLGYQSKVIKK
jgi:hypothetical protein